VPHIAEHRFVRNHKSRARLWETATRAETLQDVLQGGSQEYLALIAADLRRFACWCARDARAASAPASFRTACSMRPRSTRTDCCHDELVAACADMIRSTWRPEPAPVWVTECAFVLRTAGSGPVFPVALATTAGAGDGS
jgi:hypothetical protein